MESSISVLPCVSHRVEALTWKRYAVHRAIAKYGWEKVKYTILCIGSFEYIKDLEVKAIARYNTVAPHGYNLTLGGDGTKGLQLSKEARAAIRARMIGNDYTKGNSYTEEEKRLWKNWEKKLLRTACMWSQGFARSLPAIARAPC